MKIKLSFIFLGISILTSCNSIEVPVVNIKSATLEVGDSINVIVSNTPENDVFFSMMKGDSSNCSIKQIDNASVIVYAKQCGTDLLEAYYLNSHNLHTDSHVIYIPIEVIDEAK